MPLATISFGNHPWKYLVHCTITQHYITSRFCAGLSGLPTKREARATSAKIEDRKMENMIAIGLEMEIV